MTSKETPDRRWLAVVISASGLLMVSVVAPSSAPAGAAETATLTVNDPAHSGDKVTSSPEGIDCGAGANVCSFDFPQGAAVTLTATLPTSGWEFNGWGLNACAGQGTTCNLTMAASKSVTARLFNIERSMAALTTPTADYVRGTVDVSVDASDNSAVNRV